MLPRPQPSHPRTLLLVGALLAGLPAPTARAFSLRTGERGQILIWNLSQVSLTVSTAGVESLPAAFQAVQTAFVTWTSSGAPLRIDYEKSAAPISPAKDGRSTVVWVNRGWKYGAEVVGMTVAWYQASTGLVAENDVVLNLRDHRWSTGAPDPTGFDVQNVVSHEAGHFIGLGHEPSVPQAAMYPYTPPGETQKRSLTADDRAGLAALVLETSRRRSSQPISASVLADAAAEELDGLLPQRFHGCSTAGLPGSRGSPGSWGSPLLLLVAMLLGRGLLRRRPSLWVVLLLLSPARSGGTTLVGLSLEEMSSRADLVVRGLVVQKTPVLEDDGLIYTEVRVRPARCYKGDCRGAAPVAVRIPGGELGDLGMSVEGAPRPRLGDAVVLFASRSRGRAPGHVLLGLGLGLFRLQGQTARRQLAGLVFVKGAKRGLPGAELPVAEIKLSELEAAVARGLAVHAVAEPKVR